MKGFNKYLSEAKFPIVMVKDVKSGKEKKADVLEKSKKSLKIAIQGTDFSITLTRKDPNKPYVGRLGSMEFSVKEQEE